MGLDLIRDHDEQGQIVDALKKLEAHSEDPQAALYKANILDFLGDRTSSLKIVNDLIELKDKTINTNIGVHLLKAKILLSQGLVAQATKESELIHQYLESRDPDIDTEVWKGNLVQLEGLILEKQLSLKPALKKFENCIKIFESLKNIREVANSTHKLGFIYELMGNFDTSLKFYNQALKLREKLKNKYEISNSLNRIGVIYAKKSKLDEAHKYFKKALEYAIEVEYKLELAKIYPNLGIIFKIKGDLKKAENYYKKALHYSTDLDDLENRAKIYINVADIQFENGDLDESIQTYNNAIPLLEKVGNQHDKASLYNNLGLVYRRKGDYTNALQFLQESLKIKIELGQDKSIANALHNIGVIYLHKGELNSALENFEKSLLIWEETDNFIDKATTLQFLGLIHLERNDLDLSLDFLKRCLDLRRKINNEIEISETLHYLITAELESSNEKSAKKYYNDLVKINKKSDNKLVKTRTRLAQAILLQKDTRINKKVEAQELFEEVLAESTIDNELTIFAMLKLCEFLLLELKISGEKEVLVEIKTLLEKLYEMAQEQESHTLLIEILIIQSQLALAEYNVKETKEFLEHANEIAEDKELTQYKLKISYLQDQVEKDVIKFANIASSVPINDRINQLQIESYLKEVADHKDLNSFDPEIFKTGLKKNLQMHLNFANLLLMDKTLPEEMKKYVHFIDLSAKEIQFSISTLLMIEKLEAGTYYQNLEDFNCDEIIQFRINHYEEKLNEKSLVVDFQKTNSITTVKSDQYLFSRILDHLLDNAIKFADEKSTVKIVLETNENSRTITIENECEIIPEHEQSNLFDKYTQYLIHESTRKHGVGLGLAFCDLALKSIKGEVSLVSPRPNKDTGVSVTIIIPKEI